MDQLTHFWLQHLCKNIEGVTGAAIFTFSPESDELTLVCTHPENLKDISILGKVAKNTATSKQGSLISRSDNGTESGEHVDVISALLERKTQDGSSVIGVVGVQMLARTSAKQEKALGIIEGSIPWYSAITDHNIISDKTYLVNIVELVASSLEHERFDAAATEVVTDLSNRLGCDRISIGFVEGSSLSIEAISHSGGFDKKSGLVRATSEAMFEAVDQDSTISYPSGKSDYLVVRYHRILKEEYKIGNILTVPFVVGERIAGALLLERPVDRGFEESTVEHVEHVASLVGPVLNVRYRDEQWLPIKASNSLVGFLGKIFGPAHVGVKLSTMLMISSVLFLTLVSADYRVTAEAKLEAVAQQAIVAPLDGYIAQANVRPGDIVKAGDLLGALDDKDLQLQYSKYSSQLEQLQREYRDALARHDRAKVSIINAKIRKTEAELHLIEEQFVRSRFIAPFDGFIVSGDLSQALGSPVERGQVLFTAAPLLAYRVVLKVDERDIGAVKIGQNGVLVLSAMSDTSIAITLEKITPVSTAEAGRNYFQVEAQIQDNSDLFRPGMEGVAKVVIERKKLLWIVSHKLIDWFRLKSWSWMP